jgi:hypothetical protein
VLVAVPPLQAHETRQAEQSQPAPFSAIVIAIRALRTSLRIVVLGYGDAHGASGNDRCYDRND